MQRVGILELVHQDVLEALLVMLAQLLVARQQFVAAQQQFGKIHHAFALALRVVFGEHFHLAPRVGIVGFHLVRAQPLLLAAADEVLHLARRIFLVVHVHRLHQALDGGKLVAGIEDLEGLRQVRLAVMRAQHAVAQSVESADPHAARVDRQHRRQARHHLLGRLVGEGHRENAVRADLPGADEIGDARGQHARLAAARPGQDQRGLGGKFDGGTLFGIETGKQGRIHGRIIPHGAAPSPQFRFLYSVYFLELPRTLSAGYFCGVQYQLLVDRGDQIQLAAFRPG